MPLSEGRVKPRGGGVHTSRPWGEFSAAKLNKLLIHSMICVRLSGSSQSQRTIQRMISFAEHVATAELEQWRTDQRLSGVSDRWQGKRGCEWVNRYREESWCGGNILTVVVGTWSYTRDKTTHAHAHTRRLGKSRKSEWDWWTVWMYGILMWSLL